MKPNAFDRRLVVLAMALGGPGCGGNNPNVTHENFKRITPDMSLADVEAVLGKGSETSDVSDFRGGAPPAGAKVYVWRNGKAKIKISFVDGKMGARFYALDSK